MFVIDGNVILTQLNDATAVWKRAIGVTVDGEDPGDTKAETAEEEPTAKPMEYRIAKQRKRLPKPLAKLLERYNAEMIGLLQNAEAAGAADGTVRPLFNQPNATETASTHATPATAEANLAVMERLANRVHESPRLVVAAQRNAEKDYLRMYRTVVKRAIREQEQEPTEEGRRLLQFMRHEPISSFDDWGHDSYQTHRDEEAA